MTAQKTLFKKYVTITMTIILVSFMVLGITLLTFISNYWRNEKHDLLAQNSQGIAELFSKSGIIFNNSIYLTGSKLNLMQSVIDSFSTNINADIFITDTAGNTIISFSGSNGNQSSMAVPQNILKDALKGQYVATGNLGGIYDYKCYTVGTPITIFDPSGNKTIGVVFTSTDAKYISAFRSDVIRLFLLAALSALLISFLAVWFMSYKMVGPLRQMSLAANSLGRGDFSKRVLVNTDDEIGQLAVAFNNMADSLSAYENTRRTFIANVSHELKTPMTTIAGFIDGILDGTISSDKQDYYLNIVSNEVKRLSRLVKSMLDLSRIDSGEIKINKQKFDITSTALSILISFEKSISEKNITITGLEDAHSITVNGDPDMIHQVIYNLIENAVKFVNNNGYINVKIFEQGKNVVLKIKNSGQGISSDDINLIFDKFYKTDKSRSEDKNGMGLGLYIVKTIINLHGGDIKVCSVQNEFCEFEFWLPIDA